jgi:Domain of unknown function (DUF4372)/Transposase DDE domain
LNAFCSVFSQILKLFPRSEFEELVRESKAQRHARGFTCWEQFVAMMFCQLGRAQSLREICQGLASMEGKLNHLGIESAPPKSTLAYANKHRPAELFELVFARLYQRCRALAPKHRLRFKNPLLSIDATVIELCATVFEWARYTRTKGAVKLHMILDHNGLLPSFCHITEAKKYDVVVARDFEFASGTIVVFDRGYNDFTWFRSLTDQGVFFVTRLKKNTLHSVIEDRPVPQRSGVTRDALIRLENRRLKGESPIFRLVEYQAPDGHTYTFLTNHLKFGSTTIAAIYRQRWEIELFFKALKQNLRIKTFVGTSANALRVQIWSALIAILVLRYLKLRSSFGWSLSNLLAMLRFNLFAYRDLWTWIDNPFSPPPQPAAIQLPLSWTASEGV